MGYFRTFDERWTPEPNTGCWLWTAGWNVDGYGVMSGNVRAHRYSYEVNIGPIPRGMVVCHKCDTPACVNPAHLFVGTVEENNKDRESKGRSRHLAGSQNASSKLTEAQVLEIISDTRPQSAIASEYGVSQSNVSRIKSRQRWTQL